MNRVGTDGRTRTCKCCRTFHHLIAKCPDIYLVGKVSKGAKIRNRYNQVPHLTKDTNGKVTNSQ